MHYVASAIIAATYFVLTAWLRANPGKRHWAYFALGMLPFTVGAWNLDSAIINWPTWPGYAKGMILTLVDTLALAIVATQRGPRGLPPLSAVLMLYIASSVASSFAADIPLSSLFYVFQLFRIMIVAVAVAKISHDSMATRWLLMGLSAGIIYQAGFTVWQKLHGAFQATGTMGHQNLLGLMTHFVTLPILGGMLGGMRSKILMVGLVSALTVIAFGASRGAIGFGVFGVGLLIALSLIRHSTPHKWKIVGYSSLALIVASPVMLQAIHKRLEIAAQVSGTYDERAAFERAAKMIWADHPFGVGANEYVITANTKGYSARAGVLWTQSSRSANVHNTYLLVAAETGWPGLIAFIAMFTIAIFTGLRFAFGNRKDPRGDLALGCTIALLVTAIHIQYEWVFVTYPAQYVFAISFGLIGGLVRAKKLEGRSRPHIMPPPTNAAPSNTEVVPQPA